MTQYADILIGDLFHPTNGKAKYIKDYMDKNAGEYPVYSASITKPFGFVNSYDYEGRYLIWVMNGYGGRVQEVTGRFSINRDRGILLPLPGKKIPDLTYLRFVAEPQLSAAAVGRRVDGRLNEYTKIYPDAAREVVIRLPILPSGAFNFELMAEVGSRLRRIEAAQASVRQSYDELERATFAVEVDAPFTTIALNDKSHFSLTIGERVLTSQHSAHGIPAYSANALYPFGNVEVSNISDFERPSIIWGIDGVFDWNFIEQGQPFAHTDHCGRLVVISDNLVPEYVYWYLKLTRKRYGFDRVFRSSLTNMRAEVVLAVPLDDAGAISISRQLELARRWREREEAKAGALSSLEAILKSRVAADAW